jgi:hypothetical protein
MRATDTRVCSCGRFSWRRVFVPFPSLSLCDWVLGLECAHTCVCAYTRITGCARVSLKTARFGVWSGERARRTCVPLSLSLSSSLSLSHTPSSHVHHRLFVGQCVCVSNAVWVFTLLSCSTWCPRREKEVCVWKLRVDPLACLRVRRCGSSDLCLSVCFQRGGGGGCILEDGESHPLSLTLCGEGESGDELRPVRTLLSLCFSLSPTQ